jgi:large subunit ribosomal protein L4
MELPVRNASGQVVGTIEVSDAVFGVPMNKALVHQALVIYQANRRQGTHNTRTRGEVSGGGRKPWPQKYTGRARQGSIRSPQWRHGGVAFGPKPRDHRLKLPRKMRHLALKCVLSEKARAGKLILVDDLSLPEPSTKTMIQRLRDLGVSKSVLVVTRDPERNVVLSSRNLEKVGTLPVSLINAAELLRRDTIIMTVDAVRRAEELWSVEKPRRKVKVGQA